MLTDAERLLVGRWYRTFFRYTVYMTPSPLSSPHKRHVGCKVENRTPNLVINVRIPINAIGGITEPITKDRAPGDDLSS